MAKLLLVDLVGSVVWFPVWWYTKGLNRILHATTNAMRYRAQSYAFGVWIRNFFVPMYGQYDWTGRLISVFMRFVVLIGRLIALAFESAIYAMGVVAWGLAPMVFLGMVILNLAAARA